MTEKQKYRVHDLVRYNYSEIGEYIGDGYTDKPLRNDEIVDLLNALHEENQTLTNQLNNFRLHSKDLERENKLLKQALREELQDNGNKYYVELFDELFNLKYDEWNTHRPKYYDWEEELQLKQLGDLYD